MSPPTRADAAAMDAADPLGRYRERFVVAEPGLLYVDGNSLGRLPRATVDRLRHVVEQEWGAGLVRSWSEWIDLAHDVGDRLAEHVLGARSGEVVMADSTTVNLFKLADAALASRPSRRVLVTDDGNFPTDRYVLQGLAEARGLELRVVPTAEVPAALDDDVALLSLSHVAYRSGELLDLAGLTAAAHEVGALTLWDLSHSAGSVPVALDAAGADLAVGCTYKYLNGGPGAPSFLYVRQDLQAELRQPIWGWFGQRDQFAMGDRYDPAPDIRRFLVGTPPVLSLVAAEEGIRITAEAGMPAIRQKGIALTELVLELLDAWLAPLGFDTETPRDPLRRGAHVALRHPDAWRMTRALVEQARVVPDFREPDVVRYGLSPLTTTFVEAWDAVDRLRSLVEAGAHERYPLERARVT